MNTKDSLFSSPLGDIERFKFNQSVVDVFPDMLRRSVPGYESIITQSALLASRYVQPNTHLYDLGSSLGATAISMRDALRYCAPSQTQGCEIHGVDNSSAMVEASRRLIRESASGSENAGAQENDGASDDGASVNSHPIGKASIAKTSNSETSNSETSNSETSNSETSNSETSTTETSNKAAGDSINHSTKSTQHSAVPIYIHEADLEAHPLHNASVVAMNFTLQFVDVVARKALMAKIATALQPGGVLILSEKVCFSDPVVNQLHIDMYHAFKSANGYSDLEISQKRTALENVLVPDTLTTHHNRLLNAGFSHVSVWFQCFNFASLIAIKS